MMKVRSGRESQPDPEKRELRDGDRPPAYACREAASSTPPTYMCPAITVTSGVMHLQGTASGWGETPTPLGAGACGGSEADSDLETECTEPKERQASGEEKRKKKKTMVWEADTTRWRLKLE